VHGKHYYNRSVDVTNAQSIDTVLSKKSRAYRRKKIVEGRRKAEDINNHYSFKVRGIVFFVRS